MAARGVLGNGRAQIDARGRRRRAGQDGDVALLLDVPAVHRRDDGVVVVTGRERLQYLHLQLSQSFEAAAPGDAADFLYLDVKGNALAMGRAVVAPGAVLLVVPRDVAPGFAEALERYRFLMEVEAGDASASWRVASVRGPGVVLPELAPAPAMRAAERGEVYGVRDRTGGVDLVGPADAVEQAVRSLELPTASADDWDAWRIAAGVPAWGAEVVEGRRPQELGLLPTHVHLRKGCYPGQESIAKVWNLGRPRRALAVVHAAAPLRPGTPLLVEGASRNGEVTSAATFDGGVVALALVPLDREGRAPAAARVDGGEDVRVVRRVGDGLAQPGA